MLVHNEPGGSPPKRQTIPLARILFQTSVPVARISAVRAFLRDSFNIPLLFKSANGPLNRGQTYLTLFRYCPMRRKAVFVLSLKSAEAIINKLLR